jgi:hypothetical protein
MSRWRPVQAGLVVLLLSVAAFIATFAVRMIFLPNVVPIASGDVPQSLWAVQVAFLLRAVENVSAFSALLVLAAGIAHVVAQRIGLSSSLAGK